jgi:hypothetical protein
VGADQSNCWTSPTASLPFEPRRSPQPTRHRALELIVAHPDGCTEAIHAAESIPADVLIELVRSGLAVTRIERRDDEDGVLEVTKLWITESGMRVLAARM